MRADTSTVPPEPGEPGEHGTAEATPLWAVLALTAFASVGTGIFWNAISFVAKHAYDFSQARNLLLYLAMGVVYAVAARKSAATLRLVRRWLAPRSVLALLLVVQSVACLGPVLFHGEWALWAAVVTTALASATLWPVVESYVASGRHGAAMRGAIGSFNLTWMVAVIVPLLVMPPFLERHAEWAVGGFAFVNLGALPLLLAFRRRPGHHDEALAGANVPDSYRALLRCCRTLLPVSYLLNAALAPVLPYRFEALEAPITLETPITSIWMASRIVLLVLMWRFPVWHGRWSIAGAAAVAMAAGFACTVLAPSLALMAIGLAVFGCGLGAIYYLALYYGMAVGRADVEASGMHEALIGLGYTAGPAAGLLGVAIGGPSAIVAVTLGVVAAGCTAAFVPYLRVRRERVQSGP